MLPWGHVWPLTDCAGASNRWQELLVLPLPLHLVVSEHSSAGWAALVIADLSHDCQSVVFWCACSYWLFALQSVPLEMKDLGSYLRRLLRLGYYEYLLKLCWVESLVIPISATNTLWKVLCLLKSQEDISFHSFNLDALFWSLHSLSLLYWFISIPTLLHLYSCMWLRFLYAV